MTMTNRRTFTFASLALAASATARASDVVPQASAPSGPGARWSVERKTSELVVKVAVLNTTGRKMSIMASRGSQPGGNVLAMLEVDGTQIPLAEIREVDRREMMSRMGPVPLFVDVGAGAEFELGPWRFSLPKDSKDEAVSFVAELFADGAPFELRSGVIGRDGKSV